MAAHQGPREALRARESVSTVAKRNPPAVPTAKAAPRNGATSANGRCSDLNTSVSRDSRGSLAGSSCVAISLLSLFHSLEFSVEARRLPVIASRGARSSGKGSVQEPPSSMPLNAASRQRYLVDRIEYDQHQSNQARQHQDAQEHRIDIAMNVLEDVHMVSPFSVCTSGSCGSCALSLIVAW